VKIQGLTLVGTNENFLIANSYTLGYGRNLSAEDVELGRSVTVVGQRIQAIPGGVGGFGRAYFTVPNLPQANSYRVSVWDYTWFQSPGDRM